LPCGAVVRLHIHFRAANLASMLRLPRILVASAVTMALATFALAAVEMKQGEDTVTVTVGGKLLTEYHFGKDASHAYFYPLIGPGGARMTRDWPMKDTPGEEHDHPHHRSLWYAHGLVNGVDYWTEAATHKDKESKLPVGRIEHEKFGEVKGGAHDGTIVDHLKWVAPDGSVPVRSVQAFTVHEGPDALRVIDFTVTLEAQDKDVTFGDTKEGTMAMRIAESMRLKGPKNAPGAGHIVNSEGDADDKVWGKHARWVDMSGPVDGKVLGIAMFDHPSNPRFPTRWHARDYGLFAANPFCEHEMDKAAKSGEGDFKLGAGKSAAFKYRIILHEGDATQAKISEIFDKWVANK
jgi:hypothetical protein